MIRRTLAISYITDILKDAGQLKDYYFRDGVVSEIIIDSRTLFTGNDTLFAALRTEVDDGHRYIQQAYSQGVRQFLVETLPTEKFPEANFIVVVSVIKSLGVIASSLNEIDNSTQVLVTGSYGKSVVKEILYMALRNDGQNVWRSPRSYNSYLGIALSRCEEYFEGDWQTAIFEVGIDAPEQARSIVSGDFPMIHPQIGIITPITTEHDCNFTSHKDKIREKIALVENCSKIIYETSDSVLGDILSEQFANRDDVVLVPVEFTNEDEKYQTVFHALAAAAFPTLAVYEVMMPSTRISIDHGVEDICIMTDAFTPDLRSLRYSLERFRRHNVQGKKSILILGELLPGESEDKAISMANEYSIDNVITAQCSCNVRSHTNILIFGKLSDYQLSVVESLQRADHDTSMVVDLDALCHNYDYYRHMLPLGTGIVAMVKASAYGMGAIEVGKALQSKGAAYLAVAVVDEGVAMRDAGITMPLMVLNPVTNRYSALFANQLEPAVFSIDELQRLITEGSLAGVSNYPVHIKLDTGMHRVGFTEDSLQELIDIVVNQEIVRVTSVFSHLATADCFDLNDYTKQQIDKFYHFCDILSAELPYSFKRHILNTAGMMRFAEYGSYEMARLGIGLYGVSPLSDVDEQLKPVASLRSVIISLKKLPAGTYIGYACKGCTKRDSIIATVPIGYADGINRHLGNGRVKFRVSGIDCPTIGNICMDQCMVDVTDVENVTIGTAVEIFGPTLPVERLATALDTIPYEILTSVSPRVHRTYLIK